MIDGLGGEEVNQTTNVQTTNVVATTAISGLDIFANGSLVGNRINDTNGALFSIVTGSPAVYGPKIQVGTVATSAGSAGTIVFGTQFATNGWMGVLTAGSDNAGECPYISGTRNVSGAAIVGEASTTYNYIAVGL